MIKRPFLIFSLVVSFLVFSVLRFIQGPQFAVVLKTVVSQYLPKDTGIDVDFSELSIKFFPPGFSVKSPKILIKDRNMIKLPAGSFIDAERIDFSFRPLQVFSGDIRVHEVTIVNGQVQLVLNQSAEQKKAIQRSPPTPIGAQFHWDELFQIRTEGIALENVQVDLKFEGDKSIGGKAILAKVSRWTGRGGLGYSVELNLAHIEGSYLKSLSIPNPVDHLRVSATVNALGVQVESVSVAKSGLNVEGVGEIKGDLLDLGKILIADFKVKASGQIDKLFNELVQQKTNLIPTGSFELTGRFGGDILKPMETSHLEGLLQVKNLNYDHWNADLIEADLGWDAAPGGGDVSLKRGLITSKTSARIGGFHPGDGGKIELGKAKWTIGSVRPVSVPILFDHAHLHWLVGPGVKAIYPLTFMINGESRLLIRPPSEKESWEIRADLNNSLDEFQLDNQAYQKTKPLSVVFQIPKIGITGPVIVNSNGIRPINLKLSLPHTELQTRGQIDFKKGYDLYASGGIVLDDLQKIAGNEVKGEGTVSAHVHGLPVAVLADIDVDVVGGHYLGLNLGNLKGRIIWDDKVNHLLFSQTQLKFNETQYSVQGLIDVGPKDEVSLGVEIPKGNIHDFIEIFGNLTQNITWFPHSLVGPFKGTMKVSGGLNFSKLKVDANIDGKDWEFLGEGFKNITLSGGYDRGKYSVDQFHALKRQGFLDGDISFDQNQILKWDIESQYFTISEFDSVAQSDVPFRSQMSLKSTGSGKLDKIQSETDWKLDHFSVRGVQMPSSRLQIKTQNGIAHFFGSIFEGQGTIDVIYDLNPAQMSSITGELKQFDFSPILLLINKNSMQDKALAGNITGSLDLNFHSDAFDKSNGTFKLVDYLFAASQIRFQLAHPVNLTVKDGNFDIQGLAVQGNVGRVALDLKNTNGILKGEILGELDNSIIHFFVPSVSQATGASSLDFRIGGSIKSPTLGGAASLNGGNIRVEALESPFENLSGKLKVIQNKILFQSIQADLGGGKVSVNGGVELMTRGSPLVDLETKLSNTKIKVYPFQYAKISGLIGIHGSKVPYEIDGKILVDSALFKEKMLNQKRVGDAFKAVQYFPLPSSKQGVRSSSPFKLDIELEAPHGVAINNDLFQDVVAKGKMKLVNTLDVPRIMGRAEISQGKLIFKDHIFQIQSGSAVFDSPTVINPAFDLVANTEASGIKIQMFATGRKDDIKIEMTSNPSLPESEIFSLLALGLTSADAKKLNATDLSSVQQGEAASLVLHSLDFNRDLEEKMGIQLSVDESVNKQQGVSAFRGPQDSYSSATSVISIRKKVGDRLSFSAGTALVGGSSKTSQANFDYSVNSDMSVSGVLSNYGASSSTNGSSTVGATDLQNTQTTNSYGLDLKFIKRFK